MDLIERNREIIRLACASPGRVIEMDIGVKGDAEISRCSIYALHTKAPNLYVCFISSDNIGSGCMSTGLLRVSHASFIHSLYYDKKRDIFICNDHSGIFREVDNLLGDENNVVETIYRRIVQVFLNNLDEAVGLIAGGGVEEEEERIKEDAKFDTAEFVDFDETETKESFVWNKISKWYPSDLLIEKVYPLFHKEEIAVGEAIAFIGASASPLCKKVYALNYKYGIYQETLSDPMSYYTQYRQIRKSIGQYKTIHIIFDTVDGEQNIVGQPEFFSNPEMPQYSFLKDIKRYSFCKTLLYGQESYGNVVRITYRGKVLWEREN